MLENLVLKLQDVLAFVLLFHFEGYVHAKMVVVSLENITWHKKERRLIRMTMNDFEAKKRACRKQ